MSGLSGRRTRLGRGHFTWQLVTSHLLSLPVAYSVHPTPRILSSLTMSSNASRMQVDANATPAPASATRSRERKRRRASSRTAVSPPNQKRMHAAAKKAIRSAQRVSDSDTTSVFDEPGDTNAPPRKRARALFWNALVEATRNTKAIAEMESFAIGVRHMEAKIKEWERDFGRHVKLTVFARAGDDVVPVCDALVSNVFEVRSATLRVAAMAQLGLTSYPDIQYTCRMYDGEGDMVDCGNFITMDEDSARGIYEYVMNAKDSYLTVHMVLGARKDSTSA